MSKRAFSITTGEVSASFWGIGFILTLVAFMYLFRMHGDFSVLYPGLAMTVMIIIILLFIAGFFNFMAMVLPNYQISKNNLNVFIDRFTNPDFMAWLRLTRNKQLRVHTVKKGPLGQTKGVANGEKADVFNDGEYTITLPNGNQCIIVCDFLSTNIDLNNAIGWNLIQKHFGIVGFDAWEKAAADGELIFDLENNGSVVKEKKGWMKKK